jgi:muramidase (phage lysozyme)
MTNLEAFLAMIRASEVGADCPNPYAMVFGGKFTITDFRDHPAVLGTWHGEPLDFLGPKYQGLVSTAAGAYQLIKPTWLGAKTVLKLPDFGVASQDAAAMLLIKEQGALDLVNSGQVVDAIQKCAGVWASLPGNGAGQPQHTMADLLGWYGDAGGAYV